MCEQTRTVGWMSKEIIADLNKLHPMASDYQTLLDALLTGLQTRPHSEPKWAAIGVLEYYYDHAAVGTIKTVEANTDTVSTKGTLGAADTEKTLAFMAGGSGGPAIKVYTRLYRVSISLYIGKIWRY